MAGTTGESFQEAAEKLLPKMASIRLSESTVQRTSEGAGRRMRDLLQKRKALGGPTRWTWHKDARGITCAYVSIDAIAVRQQGPDAKAAEGRMPYVAMVFNPVPDLPAGHPHRLPAKASMQARYLSGLYSLEEMGQLLRRQAGQVGMDNAEQWIGLSDGGNGLENFLKTNFPGPLKSGTELELILDFWHASDYLVKLVKTIFPSDEERREKLAAQWCHLMKHEGGARIVEELAKFQFPNKPMVQAQREETSRYLQNNVHRMDYPRYLANGWCIGSGAMESGCKTVVGQRLKLSGMRWGEMGTDNMCHTRANYRSEPQQWELFWARKIK